MCRLNFDQLVGWGEVRTLDCYGHQRNNLIPGDPIPQEANPSGECEEKDVEASDAFDIENEETSNPFQGEAGTCSTCNNDKGKMKQKRRYGEDGFPDVDIDYDHAHGKGKNKSPKPHAHDWSRNEDGNPPKHENRGNARQPTQEELDF